MAMIHDFHAHINFDPDQVEQARAFGASLQQRFGVPLGHFHRAGRPHPRGSCQVTVPTGRSGDVATWLSVNRAGLTIFAHASTGDHRADYTTNVIWFGVSEPLALSIVD